MPKRFTLREASALLSGLSNLLRQAISLKRQYDEAEQAFQGIVQHIMFSGGIVVDRQGAAEQKARRDSVAERFKSVLEEVQETGCVIKDLDTGLVDFPTLFRGEEVYLCWRLGEPDIAFWHGVHEGFAGRKPIDQDFRDNHEGDKPH